MDLSKLFSIEGKVAVITGASQGLGRGYAIALAQAGCTCICIGRDKEKLMATKEMISDEAGQAEVTVLDVTDTRSVKESIDKIYIKYGKIDILINNAGNEIPEPFLDVSEEDYDSIMTVNTKGVFFMTQKVAEKMKLHKSGKIINIGSLGSYIGLSGSSVYCSSKGAIIQFTKTAAIELAQYNIQVNAIVPGYFLTHMTQPFFDDQAHREWIESRIPLGRIGTAEDLAGTVIFLSSGASDYLTGQSIIVDGGWLAG
ncbi:glucose 1-dehydrogenase [Sporolactobacillus sp. THM7-7]|nr:glucose 1-dehydrogenase [Sporolactobacillus sp. THM7-7]